jgi:DNA-directed RNA polymerase specialized sigma subunit|nr:MAG TPA: Protein of unknown function (DUF1492) [Bacteriophage sp.]
MSTIEYLMQISKINCIINNKLSEIAEMRQMSQSITGSSGGERVQTSPEPDRIGAICAKIDEMERKVDALIDEYYDKKQYILRQLESLTLMHYKILYMAFVKDKTLLEIADEIGYTERHTTRIYSEALREFEERYGNDYMS